MARLEEDRAERRRAFSERVRQLHLVEGWCWEASGFQPRPDQPTEPGGRAGLCSVSVRLELAPRLPRVRGDRVQVQQVILNLVLNDLDAMPESVPGDRTCYSPFHAAIPILRRQTYG